MRSGTHTPQLARVASVGALVGALVAIAVLLLDSGAGYRVHARFADAGQLVKGNLVQVAGRPVGKIADIRLTDDNQAEVVLDITDDEVRPLHEGTVATIRQVGLSGVANRFVELTPGPRTNPEIRDGGTLGITRTKGIVDLDQLLDALDAPTRNRLQAIIRGSDRALAGGSQEANAALEYLNPALGQTAGLAEELTRDQEALESLIRSSATVSSALASREPDLEQGVTNTAVALRAIASERAALEDLIARAPGVLRRSRPTLRRLRRTLAEVRPALREARPVARPLGRVLRALPPAARHSLPVVAELRRLLPELRRTLAALPPLARELVPIINATTVAARDFVPIVAGVRPYTPDLVAGLYNGFGGVTSGYFDANGHYARIAANHGAGAIPGLGSLSPVPSAPGLVGYRTGLDARCPGAAVEPAPDGSNPWVADPSFCDPEDSQR
jgi:phospholipid/cholesterol/gamma-HCH transport system substrate-binding protein